MRTIITGAGSGIGRAVAERFVADLSAGDGPLDEPSRLILVDRDEQQLLSVCGRLQEAGHEIVPVVADLSSESGTELVIRKAVGMLDGLDALVSNAGIVTSSPLELLSLEAYELAFAVNTRATWLLARGTHSLLKAAKGSLVATASLAAQQPTPGAGPYSASKAALVMLVRQMAREWGPDGIRCNCVSPGAVQTGMTAAAYADAAVRDDRAARIPLGRVGQPEDIAAVVAFLVGPDARYVTGVELPVDGGLASALLPTPGTTAG